MLNIALFGKTAKQWRDENPGKKGNIINERIEIPFTEFNIFNIRGFNFKSIACV